MTFSDESSNVSNYSDTNCVLRVCSTVFTFRSTGSLSAERGRGPLILPQNQKRKGHTGRAQEGPQFLYQEPLLPRMSFSQCSLLHSRTDSLPDCSWQSRHPILMHHSLLISLIRPVPCGKPEKWELRLAPTVALC